MPLRYDYILNSVNGEVTIDLAKATPMSLIKLASHNSDDLDTDLSKGDFDIIDENVELLGAARESHTMAIIKGDNPPISIGQLVNLEGDYLHLARSLGYYDFEDTWEDVTGDMLEEASHLENWHKNIGES